MAATPAIRHLEQAGIAYVVHRFEQESALRAEAGFAQEAAIKLGIDPERLFKTLVCDLDTHHLVVAVIPASTTLSLKALAAVAGGKQAGIARREAAERKTGYVHGGISPFGQKNLHPTYIDESALAFETLFVSGGARGLQLELSPRAFELVDGHFCAIARRE